jgi:acetyltransferase-like isoleucine patch superfamily enzyme
VQGASIGSNVRIHKRAILGQADLLAIGDNVVIEEATVLPFGLEEGHMVLLPIVIGDRCSVGVKSTLAPGSVLVSGTHIGPLSSSHELQDAEGRNIKYCRPAFPSPPVWLMFCVGMPILVLVAMVSYVPWVVLLHFMVTDARTSGWYEAELTSVYGAFLWWITPQRMVYYFALRIINRCIVPPVRLLVVILIKWAIIGKFTPRNTHDRHDSLHLFRFWLMSKLLPGGDLGGVTQLVGSHYEVVSIIYRMLGAKIGKRVYWPGSGLDIVEYDLLSVGDDVVFGSRSVVMTSTAESSSRIVFEAGCMVADRCVVLPGVRLRRGCVLGSGSLAPEGFEGPMGSMWVGSKGGSTVLVAPEDETYTAKDTQSPFGNAFYGDKAKYFVIPLWMVVPYNFVWHGVCVCYHNCPLLLSLFLSHYFAQFDNDSSIRHSLYIFRVAITAFIPVHVLLSLLALCFDVAMKWILIGKRVQGYYSWEDSSYCQRWQLHLTLQVRLHSMRRRKIFMIFVFAVVLI